MLQYSRKSSLAIQYVTLPKILAELETYSMTYRLVLAMLSANTSRIFSKQSMGLGANPGPKCSYSLLCFCR